MNRGFACVVGLALATAGAQGQSNQVYNGGFEILDDFTGEPEGWGLFNTARFREIGDGLGDALVRSGDRSLELPSGADFAGAFTIDGARAISSWDLAIDGAGNTCVVGRFAETLVNETLKDLQSEAAELIADATPKS